MRKIISIFVLASFLAGCTSVPQIGKYYSVGVIDLNLEDKDTGDDDRKVQYVVSIAKGYTLKAEEFRYAVNSFVMSRGGKSYDIEKEGRFNNYIITIPGNTLVIENLPKVYHFHEGRTIGAGVAGVISVSLIVLIILTSLPREYSAIKKAPY